MFRSDRFLKSTSESISLESHEGFVEYVRAGKLEDKTALIIDREYVYELLTTHLNFLLQSATRK
jgi:hypothetical protein